MTSKFSDVNQLSGTIVYHDDGVCHDAFIKAFIDASPRQ